MKPGTLTTGRVLLVLLMTCLTVGLVSWDHKQSPGYYDQAINDTTPKKKIQTDKKIRNLDEALEELNSVDMQVELDQAMKEVKEALKNIDTDKIRLELDMAMKEIDFSKIQKDIEASMAKIDFSKIKDELAAAMKEIDFSRIEMEIKESMDKIDLDKIKLEMEKVKDIDMKKLAIEMDELKEEMKDLEPKLKKELEQAKTEIEKAKEQLKAYKGFIDGLEKDGLLDKKAGYSLKHKDGELFINGKKASAETYNKYRTFLEKHKSFNIEQNDDDFNLDID
jgi:hypothetical protein